MQKLVWQNANGDTVDLTSGSYGITEWEGFSNASLNIQSQQVPFQDGAVFLDALIEPRELSVTLKMQDNNDLNLRYQLRRELIHKLNPKLGEGYLIYTNDFISKRIKCVAQIPLFETHNSNDSGTPKASLSWTACKPYWEDLEETVVAISGLNTIQNEGDVSAQVEIIIPAGSTNPAIANRRNQKQIKLLGSYDDIVEINTNLGQKYAKSEVLDFTWVSGGTFYGVAFGNGKYVYVGTQIVVEDYLSGKIISVDSGNSVQFNDVIFADGQFIAVGDSGKIITSPDAINWTTRTSGTSNNLQGITYGNNLFITVGASGTVLTSPDGITWTSRTSGVNTRLNKIAYGNSLYITVGNGGVILTSSNGTSWTSRTSGVNVNLYDVIFGDNLYVIVGDVINNSGVILTSSNGTSWTSRTSIMPCINSVIYKDGLYIAVGNSYLIMSKSSDGINWTNIVGTGEHEELFCINYANNNFIAVGDYGVILFSKDGINWTNEISRYYALRNICFGKNQYIGVGFTPIGEALISKSYDGKLWNNNVLNINGYLNGVTYGNNQFIAVGNNGLILTSQDSETWTSRTSGVNVNLYDVIFGDNLFIAVGDNGTILTSQDGITWVTRTSGISNGLSSITYGNNQFIAVGQNGTILTSSDGITWITRTSGITVSLRDIVYGNNLFVIVGAGVTGCILTSPDGETWTMRSSLNLTGVSYGDNLYVIVGTNNIILTSPDGITWTDRINNMNSTYSKITFNEGLFVAVGDGIFNSYISETLNLISDLTPDSDMTFNLEIGNNDILYSDDNGNGATLKYRQKYIGV